MVAVEDPRAAVVRVGDVENTVIPVPVLSERAVERLEDENDPRDVAFPDEVTAPVRLAFVVTFPEVRPDAVPVRLVAIPETGVPRAGVMKVGELERTGAPVPVTVTLDTIEPKFAILVYEAYCPEISD